MEGKRKSAQNENRFSALISLIKRESLDEIKEILHKWANLLTIKDRSGRTALHYCSEHSSALSADFILEKNPNLLTAQDNDGYTALHLSVISGNQVMTRYLIGKSDTTFINECDNESHTAIHWATVCGQLECLDLLLSSGAHPSRADIHGAYPLHYSAQMCNPHSGICIGDDPRVGLSVLNRLLQCPDVDVDCVDSDGRTPLLWAASAGSADSLLALINAGANVTTKDKDGLTALHCASSRGHVDCVETLLTLCGAEVSLMDANGCPPLFYAVTLGHADCTRLLIESGADVNVQDFKGRTAAHCGAARGQFETIKILGQLGANLWLRNSRGDLPFHEAVKSGRKELVKWLLDQVPSSVNATNSFGRSALHIAAINNNIELCKILIDIGADVNTVMKTKGHFVTPLDAALQKGYRGVAKYLLLHGALPASRISHSLNKSTVQRCPSGRPIDSFTAFDNNSPIESYDEWKARSQSTDDFGPQSQLNPMENSKTQLPKLPTLVKNSSEEQHMLETSSSTPSSLLENTNHYKNIREFETPLNDKHSTLKQAIITNVYVTNTPICHSKRVPPLKKLKKRRKTIVDNDDHKSLRVYTPSMSSSSSVINGEENIKVVLETKDDSSFKSNYSLNESMNFDEQNEMKETNEPKIENNDQKQSESQDLDLPKDDVLKAELTKQEIIESKVSQNEVVPLEEQNQEKDFVSLERDKSLEDMNSKTISTESKDLETTKQSDPKSVKSVESTESRKKSQNTKISNTSVKSSELSDKSRSSQKSTQESSRTKRSVSRRRSSVVDIDNTKPIDKKSDVKQKTDKKKSEIEKQQKVEKKSETSSKSSTRMSARKDFEEKSRDLAENIEKQAKVISKTKAKKEFSDELNKISKDSNKSVSKTEERSNPSDNNESDGKKLSETDKDVDSITYIKSDNESAKSNISSGNERIVTKSEESLQNEAELKKDESNERKVPFDKSSDKEDKGEYEEYYDQWESDSEKTVIDSQIEEKSTEDINNNNIEGSIESIPKESKETNKRSSDKQEDKFDGKSDKNLNDRTVDKSKNKSAHLKDNSKEESEKKVEQKDTKITHKTDPKNGVVGKVNDKNLTKPRSESKTSDKSKAGSGESVKSMSNKSVKTKDNKLPKKSGLTSEENKRQNEKRPSVSSKGKTSSNNVKNIKKTERNSSVVSKVKPKNDNKVESVIKTSDSLAKSSYLSASDMSINKSSKDQNVMQSSPLKNSISNQDINQYRDNIEDKNITNISSEESIFDSSLVMADIERDDTRMYSDIDRICPKEDPECPVLQHIQGNDLSPERFETCNEFCNAIHKPESRCCHKLHFKSQPAHLGKVEVSHIGSRVDSIRDNQHNENVHSLGRDRVRRVRRVRPSSDGYKSVDPNIITQTVEKSLRKYQLERKLFEELHDLKRFQIRSGKSNEILMVKRLVDKFRREVKAPGMTDFNGCYTYKNYELYLYDQLRRLSTSNEGKVALLTRSVSHENIQLIRISNESITQSSPELMQNNEGLDIKQQKRNETTHEIQSIDNGNQSSSQNLINEKQSTTEQIAEEVMEVVSKTVHHSVHSESSEQNDLGNDNLDNFDNEFEVKKEIILDQSCCDEKVTALTQNSTHYQNSEVIQTSQNFRITEEVSHLVIDSTEQPNHCSELKSDLNESQSNSTKISERDEQICITSPPNPQPFSEQKPSLVEKIEQISENHSNSILNEALNEQISRSPVNGSNSEPQIRDQKTSRKTSLESTESRALDQISDAKSTYGSTKSAKVESRTQYSSVSRNMSSKSLKSNHSKTNRKKTKERQSFKKECLKTVVDTEPSERAKNRKKFKRLKTRIPPKHKINVLTEEIRNRWKAVKETEMKKVFLLRSHKQNELISGFTLWYELNKRFRDKSQSIDAQIDRYINENRTGLQRTHSDSYLSRYKLDSNSITLDKSIK